MNKRKLFYLTRRTSFLWKSSMVLIVILITLGSGISFLNTKRLDAMQRITSSPRHLDEFSEELDELRIRKSNPELVGKTIHEILISEAPLHDKLVSIQYVFLHTSLQEAIIISSAEGLPNLSADEYAVISAFIPAAARPYDDRAYQKLLSQAESKDPVPAVNYALALIHENKLNNAEAIMALKREIDYHNSNPARQKLVSIYVTIKDYIALEQLMSDPAFKPFITNYVLREIALSKMDWPVLIKVHFLSEYEEINLSMMFLALASGMIWLTVLMRFNGSLSVLKFAIPALLLGVLSTHATVLFIYWQEYQIGFRMGTDAITQLVYCIFGIGLREEALKLLFFIPLIPFLIRRNDLEVLTVAGLVGLGFAIEENINYFEAVAGLSALGRFTTANFLHIALTAMCGLGLTRAIAHKGEDVQRAALTFGMAVVVHGLYDAFIMVPVLEEYSFFSMTLFILMSYQYFGWIRYLRDEWKDPISTTAVFTYGIILVAGLSFGLFAWKSGPLLALQAIGFEAISVGIILILYYREIPETIE